MEIKLSQVVLVTLFLVVPTCMSGVAHKSGQHEREADGAFSPRDSHHNQGGNHNANFDHEAILGSSKEAEEFDHLPPEESKKRLSLLLEKMDRNLDKVISKDELTQWILRSFRSLSQEESSERFKDADLDEDGKVSWNEYQIEEFDLNEDDPENDIEKMKEDPERFEELSLLEEDKILFNAADKDKNGFLSPAEFLSFTHPEEDKQMHETVLNQILKEKDSDQNGELSFQEFVGDRAKDQTKEWLMEERERFDEELDKNKDGSLDKAEILAWMIPSNEDVARDEVQHLFAGADEDVDGVLTFEEVLDHHELFVGSEATDYGEQLHNIHKIADEL